jgi:hypothetical protein
MMRTAIVASHITCFIWMAVTVVVTSAVDCDTSNPPSTNPFYKAFCGQTFVVGFSDEFSPYSWYVDPSEEEEETLRYVTSVPAHTTLDGWLGLDPDIMDEIADFLGFNYTVVDVRLPGELCCICSVCCLCLVFEWVVSVRVYMCVHVLYHLTFYPF